MTKNERKEQEIQRLTRHYLGKLKRVANKYGLGGWVDNIRKENKQGKCKSTEYTCNMLATLAQEDRMYQQDIPRLFGISYNKAFEMNLFEKIAKKKCNGTFNRVSALLLKAMIMCEEKQGNKKHIYHD